MDLKEIYLTTLRLCSPEILVREYVRPDMPRHVVAIGKCAAGLLDGVASVIAVESAFVAVPEGYPLPRLRAEIHRGGHPHMTPSSFAAGRALLEYVDAHDDILFLVSGGGSACVEVPPAGLSEAEVAVANAQLIASGLPIAEINAQRRAMSAIKGGKLAGRVRGRAITLVYSDVSRGALADVASGPTLPGSDAFLIADNASLVHTAAQLVGAGAVIVEEQIENDIDDAARFLAARARMLGKGQVIVAGGEPTVVVRGSGRGGRCTELAVRFALLSECEALFGSSDGLDGNSGVAGIHLPRRAEAGGPAGWAIALPDALEVSDSFRFSAQVGEPIMIAPTGNNLRDLFLVART